METACSLKNFVFRRVSHPGVLKLEPTKLIFKQQTFTKDDTLDQIFPLAHLTKVKLKKSMFQTSLNIMYGNEWFTFHNFQDENYLAIYHKLLEFLKK